MPYLTVLLVIAAPLLVEWALSSIVPLLWAKVRGYVLPVGTGALGWAVPMQVLPAVPLAEHGLAAFLGLVTGTLVALAGHFRDTFWSGPREDEVAMTGRRSMYAQGRGRGG